MAYSPAEGQWERKMVRSRAYRSLVMRIWKQHRVTLRDFISDAIERRGLNVTELARELGIDRQRLYDYARAVGWSFDTQTVVRDLWDSQAAQAQAEQLVAGMEPGEADEFLPRVAAGPMTTG